MPQGHEINAQALDALRAGDVTYQEMLEVFDGADWWAFTNGPEPFTAKVLVGREAASFFPFTPEKTTAETVGSEAYSQAIVGEDVQIFHASQTAGGGVQITVWAYGSLVPISQVSHDLWGADHPFQEIAGVYWRNGIYYVLGKRFAETWNGYKWVDTSNPAWAAWNSSTGTWTYGYLAGETWQPGVKVVQQGTIDPYENLYCRRLDGGRLWAWEVSLSAAETAWPAILSGAVSSENIVESYGVTGVPSIAQSTEALDVLLFYSKTDGWTWQWKYSAGTKEKIWESGAIPLAGAGVLHTFQGEYKILGASAHGVMPTVAGASLPSSLSLLGARAISESYARGFYYSGGYLKTFRLNLETGVIDQATGTGISLSEAPNKSFWPVYVDATSEVWITNNHNRVQFVKVDPSDGSVVWVWDDWAGVLGSEPAGARLVPTSVSDRTAAVWCGGTAVTGISLGTVAAQTSAAGVTSYLAGLSTVSTGFAGDMGQGDPCATQARTSANDLLVPYLTWSDAGGQFRMDLHVARFSPGMVLQDTATTAGIWYHDWDAGYPKPDEWHAAFMPQYHQNFFGVVNFTDMGYAPIWCDVSPWLLNENGVRSYYQQPDRIYYVADTLLFFEELPISRSTYPDGCHVALAGLDDKRYRFFGFDARGEIGFWSWAPGDDAPVEKTIETGWMSNYSTTAIFTTPGGAFGALFWDIFSRKLRFLRSSAANARVVDQVALKVTTSSDPINTIQDPIDTDDAFMSLYASGQRAWFGLEMTGNYSVRGLGSSSVYEEHDFIPYPFRREGIRMDLNSLEKQTKVILPDTEARDIREMVRAGTDFRGKRCILRRLLGGADPLDAGSVITLIDGYIQDWSTNSEQGLITFTVTHSSVDARNPFPPRLLSLNCGHKFKGTRCQYLGSADFCDHTKPTCQALNNLLRFGGFEHVAARQRRVLWR